MSKQSKHKLNKLRQAERTPVHEIGPHYALDEEGRLMEQTPPGPEAAEGLPRADARDVRLLDNQVYLANRNRMFAELEGGRENLEELARMVRENPEMTSALTLQERGDLIKAGVYQANLESPWVRNMLRQAEAQDHTCSICGERFEGTGHNAEPAARGRCCRRCDVDKVIPMRKARIEAGYEYAPIPGTGGKMRDWSKPTGRRISEEPGVMLDDLTPERLKLREEINQLKEVDIAPNEARIDRTPAGAGKSPALTNKIRRDPETQVRLPSMADLVKQNLIQDIPTTLEKLMSEFFPHLMQKFYPRVYEEVGRYHSPKKCAAFFANMVAEMETLGYQRAPTAYRLMLPALEPMAQRRMPMFFIAPDLMKAIQLTDFPGDIDWTTLKMPYEQGIFILPKGSVVHPKDGDVAMIVWARLEPNTPYPCPMADWHPIVIGNKAFIVLGLCIKTGVWYDSTFNADLRPTLLLHNMFYREKGERTPAAAKSTNLDADLDETDEMFLEKLGVVCFGTFLVMNAKPELVEKGKLLKRVSRAKDEVKEFWSPNIIGPKYRLKREVPRIDRYGKFSADQPKRDLGGTHASPRYHWRRGHVRQQAYGKGYKEHKEVWLEPMAIGLKTEEEAKEAGA